jgi:hypothetical protein
MGRNADNSTNLTDFEKAFIGNGIHDPTAKGADKEKQSEDQNPRYNTKQIEYWAQGSRRFLNSNGQELEFRNQEPACS